LSKPPEQITYEERVFVKACEFGLMYGMGTYTLAEDNNMTIEQAEEFYNLFFSMFPVATKWLQDQEAFAHRYGFVRNTFGRVRRLPDIHSKDKGVVAAAERQARNSPIQSAASDITNLALTRINKAFKREKMQARLLLQVHDEILSEAPPEEIHKAVEIVEQEMLAPIPGFNCPLSVDAEVVLEWGGEKIDPATIS
jgi:DNA polymerase-1